MFEIVVTKLPHYLLVIFPMLALLTADWLGPAIVAAGVGMAIFGGVGYVDWLARASMLNVSRRAAQALHESGATEAAMVRYKEPSLGWYAGESGGRVQEAEESVLKSGTGFAVSTRRRLSQMPAEVQARWEVAATIKARLYNNSLESADVLILKGRRGERATD